MKRKDLLEAEPAGKIIDRKLLMSEVSAQVCVYASAPLTDRGYREWEVPVGVGRRGCTFSCWCCPPIWP